MCQNDRPNADVRFFLLRSKTCYYFPKGLDQVFVNLTGISFERTKLKTVTKQNLKLFTQLVMFNSIRNEIQFLEKDLFMYNTRLEYVNLRFNKITFIDATVFSTIQTSLVRLFLEGTAIPCGLVGAINKNAVSVVLDRLSKSACADINNAPPLYAWWIRMQEQGGSGGSCEAELVEKEKECQAQINTINAEHERALQCAVAPEGANCPRMIIHDK